MTAGCPWRCHRCSHTILPGVSKRPPNFTRERIDPTSSSRFRAPREGLSAIEETIFAGVPVNVTLLFSREQYIAAAEAYLRGIERRIEAGLGPEVGSVASLFISRWDKAVMGKVPEELQNRLGIAIAKRTYKAYRDLLASPRWQKLARAGAQPQRLLWASTGTKDPKASDVLYIEALAAPVTINTMPEETLLAFADHGKVNDALPVDGGDAEEILARFAQGWCGQCGARRPAPEGGSPIFRQVLERTDGYHCIKEPCAWESDSDGRKAVKKTTATSKTRPRRGTIMNMRCDRALHILFFDPVWQRLSPEEIWQ